MEDNQKTIRYPQVEDIYVFEKNLKKEFENFKKSNSQNKKTITSLSSQFERMFLRKSQISSVYNHGKSLK